MAKLSELLTQPKRRQILLISTLLLAMYNLPFFRSYLSQWLERSILGFNVINILAFLTIITVGLAWQREL